MNRRRLMQAAGLITGAAAAPAAATAAPNRIAPAAITTRDGLRLAYEDWGRGPPIVFVHSWALHQGMWSQQVPALAAEGFRCITFDRRGHGRSEGNGHGYDADTLADDVGSVLDQLDLHGVTLVGHSMGCCEIARYLSRHGSGRVRRVVMLAPVTPFLTKTADNPLGFDPAMLEAGRAIWRADYATWVAENTAPFFTPQTSTRMQAWMAGMMLDCPLTVALAMNQAIAATDFRPDLAKLRTPTLVVHGDKDVSAPLDLTGRPTAAQIAGARLEVMAGAPDGLFVTHAGQVNRAVAAFAA